MNPMGPLAELRDIVTPPPPSAWPWAPGWWILLILALLLLSTSIWWLWRWQRHSLPRRLALTQLAQLQQQVANPQTLRQLSKLLREVALQAYPWEQVACLNGRHWLEFLDQTGDTTQFTQGPGQILSEGPYRPPKKPLSPKLFVLCREWIQLQNTASQFQKPKELTLPN